MRHAWKGEMEESKSPQYRILRENTFGIVHCVILWTFWYQKIPWKWLERYWAQKFREIVVTEGKFCDEHVFFFNFTLIWIITSLQENYETNDDLTGKIGTSEKCNQVLEKVHQWIFDVPFYQQQNSGIFRENSSQYDKYSKCDVNTCAKTVIDR